MRQIGDGRYVPVRELGRGGMGVVWLAEDRLLGREVAVKELTVSGSPERVVREARTASRLRDPGVVTVYDLLMDGGQTYIVMEFVDAPTLADLVGRDGPMSASRAARLGGELLSALEAAHEAGIVHRDVKPGNVMVPPKGTAKLTDFGIAQSFEDPRLTSTGVLIGSPPYMSPERLSGGEPAAAWDLWALGATLFFAVEGYDAYQRATNTATMLAVLNERAEVTQCRGPLAEVITGLMEPDPAQRLTAAAARRLLDQAAGTTRPKPTAALPDPGNPRPTAVAAEPGQPNPTAVYTSDPSQPKPTAIYMSEPGQPNPTAGYEPGSFTPDPSQPNPFAPGSNPFAPGADPYANHPHRERVMAQQAQAMARFRRLRTLTRIAMVAGVVIMVAALVPVIMSAIDMNAAFNQPIITPGATTPNATATTTTRTTTPAVIAAMQQPILTYGAGGDITSDTVPSRNAACYAWTPTKGKPAPKTFDYVDCDAPHGVQSIDYGIITPEADAPYPTPEQMTSRAVALCTKQFLSRVTVADKERSLRYWVLVPSPAAWSSPEHAFGERSYWCVAGKADGTDLTRSIEE
ncbi:serine/threonine-protein kinase [Kutzneria buriramensis]|uniref:non-specific serine/threonine protein kinase n=1 Tax=Kutzneria buriramensis TaxID=1045776 RepID=A0A3E0H2Q7_9PSEU|nr:serine/threonine-protein kinase [Kutzneria buriramensis]REH37146.1 serine/threonine protein kinase [Kutzneria buriramensis]